MIGLKIDLKIEANNAKFVRVFGTGSINYGMDDISSKLRTILLDKNHNPQLWAAVLFCIDGFCAMLC